MSEELKPEKAPKKPKKTEEEKAAEKAARAEAKERAKDTKNGITRPAAGVTALVWATADMLSGRLGRPVERAEVVASLGESNPEVNVGTIHTQFGRWRKYYDLTETKEQRQDRLAAKKAETKAKKDAEKAAAKAKATAEKEAAKAAKAAEPKPEKAKKERKKKEPAVEQGAEAAQEQVAE